MNVRNLAGFCCLALAFFMMACSSSSDNPIGPKIDYGYYPPGYYDITEVNTVSDFDSPYLLGASLLGTEALRAPTSVTIYANTDFFVLDNGGQWQYLTDGELLDYAPYTNRYMEFTYERNNVPTIGYDDWFGGNFEWVNGDVDLTQYGNALYIRTRGVGSLVVEMTGTGLSTTILLDESWSTHLIPFEIFTGSGDLARCTGMRFAPPTVPLGTKGKVDIDFVMFVFYSKKR